MKILITGGAGYIGRACLVHLRRAGHECVAFDDLSNSYADDHQLNLIEGSVWGYNEVDSVIFCGRFDVVIHCAALASVPESVSDPQSYWGVNVAGTQNVLDAMVSAKCKRLIFASTAAAIDPVTPYGASKLAAEHLVRDYSNAYGIKSTIFRFFNVAGADPDLEYGENRKHETHLIPLKAAREGTPLTIYGGGNADRDYVHISDVAEAHRLALESNCSGCDTYDLGCGKPYNAWEVLRRCSVICGYPISTKDGGNRPGDAPWLVAHRLKAQTELGWHPQHDLMTIIKTAWEWEQKKISNQIRINDQLVVEHEQGLSV